VRNAANDGWDAVSMAAGIGTRKNVTYTTASLANNASETGAVALGKSGALFYITADRAARVRIYATAAKRDADLARAAGSDRTANDLMFAEIIFTSSLLGIGTQDPVVRYYNLDATVVGNIYVIVQNTSGATSTVAITFTVVPGEN
jgi:hypothetical protein